VLVLRVGLLVRLLSVVGLVCGRWRRRLLRCVLLVLSSGGLCGRLRLVARSGGVRLVSLVRLLRGSGGSGLLVLRMRLVLLLLRVLLLLSVLLRLRLLLRVRVRLLSRVGLGVLLLGRDSKIAKLESDFLRSSQVGRQDHVACLRVSMSACRLLYGSGGLSLLRSLYRLRMLLLVVGSGV